MTDMSDYPKLAPGQPLPADGKFYEDSNGRIAARVVQVVKLRATAAVELHKWLEEENEKARQNPIAMNGQWRCCLCGTLHQSRELAVRCCENWRLTSSAKGVKE